jgi:photosystem II stability/assembly factor-like uncharacterized protein
MKRSVFTFTTCLMFTSFAFSQPATFQSRGVGGGGALFSPSFNPTNPSEYYIACDMSELFHTTDLGQSYNQVDFNQFHGGHNSKVCFTNTAGLLYSISYIADIGTPVTSTDNGVTWNTLAGNPDPFEDVYTIHVDYNNPSRIIISQYGAIYFSNNSGTSFTNIHNALDNGAGNVVGGVFWDGNTIYIGSNDGVIVSTNAGTNWNTATITGLPANDRIWSFCGAKSGATTRLFCLTGDVGDIYVGLQGSDYYNFFTGIYSCDYGSSNWVAAMGALNGGVDFPMFIDMAENNIDIVWCGGSNSNGEPTMFKTTNAGANWVSMLQTNNNQNVFTGWSGDGGDRGWGYGECAFGIDVCNTNPNYAMLGDFGFPHYTSDGGASWHQAYVDVADQHAMNTSTPQGDYYHSVGIENTTCWQIHWIDANNMWACYSDIRGCRSTDAGDMWSFDYSGYSANSSYRIVQHPNGTLFMGSSNIHDMYQSTRLQDGILDATDANGRINYSTDNGQTWQELEFFNHPVFWITLDPNNPNRAYASVIHYNGGAGIGGVYRCDDLNNLTTATWTLLPDPPRTEKHPASLVVLNDGKLVASFSGRRNGGGTFTSSSGVFMYDPVGNNWQDVSDPGMHYWTKDVVIDPNDPAQNTWYVGVFSGWGGPPNGLGGLYKTTNRGTTWTKLTGSTLDRVTSCTFNPSDPDEMYVTTEVQGLWISSDINNASPTFNPVTSYPFRQPERVFFNPYDSNEVWVTSFGNGMKVGLINNPSGIVDFSVDDFKIFPNPANHFVNVQSNLDENIWVDMIDMNGKKVLNYVLKPGINTIDVSALTNGVYTIGMNGRYKKVLVAH